MKKFVFLVIATISLLVGKHVYAKDTVYSLNKYNEEELDYILKDPTGYVVAGTFNKGTKKEQDTQVLLLKYRTNNTIEWKYSYGDKEEDILLGLSYTYDDNKIDGYVLVVEKESTPLFVKVDLEGKLVYEKALYLPENTKVNNIIEVDKEGYSIFGTSQEHAFLAKYNKNLDLIWTKEQSSTSIEELIYLENIGYYGVESLKGEDTTYQVIKYDLEGNKVSVIKEDFEKNILPHIEKGIDSYLIYGYTKEIKLSENEIGSYYIMKYSKEDIEEWDTIGNTPVSENTLLKVQTIQNNNEITDYYILSINSSDHSIEVTRLNSEGIIQEKVKKLKNDYYDIHNFLFEQDILYFVGQINCPEDDNCDYDANSLFLVCTEDKVIEVPDNDSRLILVVMTILIIGVFTIYGIKKKKKLNIKKH